MPIQRKVIMRIHQSSSDSNKDVGYVECVCTYNPTQFKAVRRFWYDEYGKPIREWTSEEYLNFCPTYAYQIPYSSIHTDIIEANAHCVETREFTCKPNDVKYPRMIFYRDYDYQKQKYIDEPRDGVCHLEEEFFGEYENWKYK